MATQPKQFEYGIGGLAILVISVAVAAIVYGLNMLTLDIYVLPAWIFGPLGVYTVIYSLAGRSKSAYFLIWGTIMIAVAVVSASYKTVQPVLIVGIVAIVLVVMGLITYVKGRK